MKSIVYTGGTKPESALNIRELKIPKLKKNQVLVKVKNSSFNIKDYERFKDFKKLSIFAKVINLIQGKNVVLGCEVSGTVEDIGENVKKFKIGDQVFGLTSNNKSYGGWSEYTICDCEKITLKPKFLSFVEAAVISYTGITAIGAIQKAKISEKDTVLVYGASGGVGLFTAQYLKSLDINITAVCSSRNIPILQKSNINNIINYEKNNIFEKDVKYNKILVINGYNNIGKFEKILKDNGKIIVVGNSKQVFIAIFYSLLNKHIKVYSNSITNKEKLFEKLCEYITKYKYKPYIDGIYDINNINLGIQYITKIHSHGKIALKIKF